MDPEAQAIAFVRALERKDFDDAVESFDSKLASALTPFMLDEAWTRALRTAGSFIDIATTRTACHLFASEIRIVFVTCKFARAMVDFEVSFSGRDEILGLAILRHGFVE